MSVPSLHRVYLLSDYSRKTEIITQTVGLLIQIKLTYLSLAKSVSAQVKHSQCPQLGCTASFSSSAHFGQRYFSRSFFSKMAGSTLWPGMPVSVSQVDQSEFQLLVGLLKCVLDLAASLVKATQQVTSDLYTASVFRGFPGDFTRLHPAPTSRQHLETRLDYIWGLIFQER